MAFPEIVGEEVALVALVALVLLGLETMEQHTTTQAGYFVDP